MQEEPSYPAAKNLVHRLLPFLEKDYGLVIPKRAYPSVSVGSPKFFEEIGGNGVYNVLENRIILNENRYYDVPGALYATGSLVGEEAFGHFPRMYFVKKNKVKTSVGKKECGKIEKEAVSEFYGYMGKKMLFASLEKRECADILFGENGLEPLASKETHRAKMKALFAAAHLLHWNREKAVRTRQAHRKGYKAASKISLDDIHDREAFFSLPTEEAERRFLKPNPDMSGL